MYIEIIQEGTFIVILTSTGVICETYTINNSSFK